MKASKIGYMPVGLALGATSGMIAGAAFKQAWKMLGRHDDALTPPTSTAPGRKS